MVLPFGLRTRQFFSYLKERKIKTHLIWSSRETTPVLFNFTDEANVADLQYSYAAKDYVLVIISLVSCVCHSSDL